MNKTYRILSYLIGIITLLIIIFQEYLENVVNIPPVIIYSVLFILDVFLIFNLYKIIIPSKKKENI